jgi:hypothetical protein
LTPMFCDFLAWRANITRLGQYGRRCALISWPAGYSNSLSYDTTRRHHLSEENTSKGREESASVDFARPNQ